VASDGVKPRKHRLTGTIGVADFMDPQPGFLEKVIGFGTADELRDKEAVQLRTNAMNERCGGGEIAVLIARHQQFEIGVPKHKWNSGRVILISLAVMLQTILRALAGTVTCAHLYVFDESG